MNQIRLFVILSCALGCGAISVGQLDTSRGEEVASQFAERLGRDGRWLTIEEVIGHRLVLQSSDCTVGVDTELNVVTSWTDDKPEAEPTQGSTIAVRDEESAWSAGEAWAKSAGISLPPRTKCIERRNSGKMYGYTLRFTEVANGHRVLIGNRVLLELNRFTGEVTTMMRFVGFHYDAVPTKMISERDAMAAFARAIEAHYDIAVEVKIVGKGYTSSGGANDGVLADPARPNLIASKRARLAYQVQAFGQADGRAVEFGGSVDAETGMVLDGGMSRGNVKLPTKGKSAGSARAGAFNSVALLLVAAAAGSVATLVGMRLIRLAGNKSAS